MVEKRILAVLLEFSKVVLAVFVKEQNSVIVSEQLTRFARCLIQISFRGAGRGRGRGYGSRSRLPAL